MKAALLWFSMLVLAGAGTASAASRAQLKDVRLWAAPDRTRVVFDLSGNVKHRMFTLDNPARVVIDLDDAKRAKSLSDDLAGKGFVKRVRTGVRHGSNLRVVLDLSRKVTPKSFELKPNEDYGHRLVVDLENESAADPKRQPVASQLSYSVRDFVVAVDAGHGGEDPGATGPDGVHEKTVTLQIARRLAKLIDAQPEMRAVLTRKGDYYVGLRQRVREARKAKADLFISIHADAFPDRNARGSSVYVLSNSGASSEHARWLARRENAADLIGGVSLKNKDKDLASFMLDLSQSASIEASLDLGSRLLKRLNSIGRLHKHRVQQAGFMVLKSPDIPSVLVETAFITNPHEERLLSNSRHQQKLAKTLLSGIKSYVASYRPAPSVAGIPAHYKVRRGESLSVIAQRFHVSLAQLKQSNHLHGSTIRVGQTLVIPGGNDALASAP